MDIYAIGAMRRTKLMIGGRILALAIQFTLARDAAGQQATSQLVPLLDRQSEIALVTSAYLRDECLNETLFTSLAHAREVLSIWKDDYNTVRPHSGLGNLSPAAYAKRSDPRTQRDGACATPRAPRPIPLLRRANKAQINPGLRSSLDESRGSGQGLHLKFGCVQGTRGECMPQEVGCSFCTTPGHGWPSTKFGGLSPSESKAL
jgi:Integrase core domain